jgi:hypothetical protein
MTARAAGGTGISRIIGRYRWSRRSGLARSPGAQGVRTRRRDENDLTAWLNWR